MSRENEVVDGAQSAFWLADETAPETGLSDQDTIPGAPYRKIDTADKIACKTIREVRPGPNWTDTYSKPRNRDLDVQKEITLTIPTHKMADFAWAIGAIFTPGVAGSRPTLTPKFRTPAYRFKGVFDRPGVHPTDALAIARDVLRHLEVTSLEVNQDADKEANSAYDVTLMTNRITAAEDPWTHYGPEGSGDEAGTVEANGLPAVGPA